MSNLIVVLMGGLSGERKISFLTGRACSNALKKKGYKVVDVDAKGYFVEKIKKLKPKIIFNALHGKYGEDGFVQSILESLKIPYTHSGVLASSLAMDKELSRIIFKKNNLRVPKYFLLYKGYEKNLNQKIKNEKIKFPIVIKPINEGSSLGVYICKNIKNFKKKYKKLINNYDRLIVEEYIPGREIQVAIMGKKSLGAIELIPRREFYDYDAKYFSNKTKYLCPSDLSKNEENNIQQIALEVFKETGASGWGRVDFIMDKDRNLYFLEINTVPGMTSHSLVPMAAKSLGIGFDELVIKILNA